MLNITQKVCQKSAPAFIWAHELLASALLLALALALRPSYAPVFALAVFELVTNAALFWEQPVPSGLCHRISFNSFIFYCSGA